MIIIWSHTTPQFEKDFLSLSIKIQDKAQQKIQFFETNISHRGLRVHKLKGILRNFWAFSIDKEYRVIFRFLPK